MSKLTSPSVSDSFNAPGKGPHTPGTINWPQVGIMALIAVLGATAFGLIIHLSQRNIVGQLVASNEKVMKSLRDANNTKVEEGKPVLRQGENQTPEPGGPNPTKS